MIQNTPLVIWNSEIEATNVLSMVDTADIPVTLFNMFGIDYDPRLYMGTDVFSKNHEDFVYFTDYSWYDGKYYSKKDLKESEYAKKISTKVNNKIKINGKIISSDFYKNYKK